MTGMFITACHNTVMVLWVPLLINENLKIKLYILHIAIIVIQLYLNKVVTNKQKPVIPFQTH